MPSRGCRLSSNEARNSMESPLHKVRAIEGSISLVCEESRIYFSLSLTMLGSTMYSVSSSEAAVILEMGMPCN